MSPRELVSVLLVAGAITAGTGLLALTYARALRLARAGLLAVSSAADLAAAHARAADTLSRIDEVLR